MNEGKILGYMYMANNCVHSVQSGLQSSQRTSRKIIISQEQAHPSLLSRGRCPLFEPAMHSSQPLILDRSDGRILRIQRIEI